MSKTNVVVTRDTARTLPPLLLLGLFFVSGSVVELLGTLSVMVDAAAISTVELLGTLSVMVDVALMEDFLTETGKGYVVNHTQ